MNQFVTRQNGQFFLNSKRFRFLFGNQYSLIGDVWSQANLDSLFALCQSFGIPVLRTWALDPYCNFRSLQYPIGANLLTNPLTSNTFSGYDNGNTNTPPNGSVFSFVTSPTPYIGQYCVKQNSSNGTYDELSYLITVNQNTNYVFGFYYQGTHTSGDPSQNPPRVIITDTNGNVIASGGYVSNANSWQLFQLGFNTGGFSQVRLTIQNWGGQNLFYYNNFSFGIQQTPILVWNEASFQQVDLVLQEAAKYNIKLILSLADNPTFNTKGTYVNWVNQIKKKSLSNTFPYLDFFTDPDCIQLHKDLVHQFVTRKNTLTGMNYLDDPNIFSWELGNELRTDNYESGLVVNTLASTNLAILSNLGGWADALSSYIKSIDPNHLVGFGDMAHGWAWANGDTVWNGTYEGVDYGIMAALPNLDYVDVHLYPAQGNSSDINGFGQYLLGIGPGPSGPGLSAQIQDFVKVAKAHGKPVMINELSEEKEYIRSNSHYTMYPRSAFLQAIMNDFFGVGGDAIGWWSVSHGANSGFEFDLDPWDGNTTNLNFNDTAMQNIYKNTNAQFVQSATALFGNKLMEIF